MRCSYFIFFIVFLVGCKSTPSSLFGSTYESIDGRFIESQQASELIKNQERAVEIDGKYKALRAASDRELIHSWALSQYLEGMMSKLLKGWDKSELGKIQVLVASDESYAAKASVDTVVINIGIINDAKYEDEIAFVMAHELSHILLNHQETNDYFSAQKAIIDKASNAAIMVSMFSDIEKVKTSNGFRLKSKNSDKNMQKMADAYKTGMTINRLSRDVLSSSIAREQEDEADLLAIDLMVKAGYNPTAYIEALERIAASQQFSEQQLKEKKSDFQTFVTMASSSEIPTGGSSWDTIGYLAANEGATYLLQWFADRHNDPLLRKSDLNRYAKREYRSQRRTPKVKEELVAVRDDGELKRFWFASQALKAIEFGDLKAAEKLALQSIQGSTATAAYTRLALFKVRMNQNQPEKALKNLGFIQDWNGVSIEGFLLASAAYKAAQEYEKAEWILEEGEKNLGIRDPFHVARIQLYQIQNQEKLMLSELKLCRELDSENIVKQCHFAAGVEVAEAEMQQEGMLDGLKDSVGSFIRF